MDIIKFDSLNWLRSFKRTLEHNYKKMFYPGNEKYRELWQLYVDSYYKAKEIGLVIPSEMDYPLYEDYFLTNSGYNNHTQYFKDNSKIFFDMMRETIFQIDNFIKEKEV